MPDSVPPFNRLRQLRDASNNLAAGNHQSARAACAAVLEKFPGDMQALELAASIAIAEMDYADAYERSKACVLASRTDARHWERLGSVVARGKITTDKPVGADINGLLHGLSKNEVRVGMRGLLKGLGYQEQDAASIARLVGDLSSDLHGCIANFLTRAPVNEWKRTETESVLPVFYDVSMAPLTFDAAVFFAFASGFAQVNGFDLLDITIVARKFRQWSVREKAYGEDIKSWRLQNIVYRLATLLPNVRTVVVNRGEDIRLPLIRFPTSYTPEEDKPPPYFCRAIELIHMKGADVQVYRASDRAMSWAASQFKRLDRAVVLTLRNADFDLERNSRIEDWLALYRHLSERGFDVVVIPDQNDALGNIQRLELGWNLATLAAVDLDLRLALHSSAVMNFSWSGGQSMLLWLSRAPFRIFGVLNRASRLTNASALALSGPTVGSQPAFFRPNQRILWADAAEVTLDYLIAEADKALCEAGFSSNRI